jgi:hypothetical protein
VAIGLRDPARLILFLTGWLVNMPFSRANLLAFSAGVAAGAVAYKTYPRWKHKVEPLVTAVRDGVTAAFHDARAASETPASSEKPPNDTAPGDARVVETCAGNDALPTHSEPIATWLAQPGSETRTPIPIEA